MNTALQSLNQKTEYSAIDFFKFFCALLVMNIHIPAFSDVNPAADFWFTQVLSRIAVPFFFIASGYFLADKMSDRQKMLQYILRIFKLYVLYTILYIPAIAESGISLKKFLFNFFLSGSYKHLWYFLALIAAAAILYFFEKTLRFPAWVTLSLSGLLFCLGVLCKTYRNLFSGMPDAVQFYKKYTQFFVTTRNGVFFGLFFLALGYFTKKYSSRIKNRSYLFLAAGCFILMNIEACHADTAIAQKSGLDMLFSMGPAALFIFLTVCFLRVPNKYLSAGKTFRNLSTLIFGLHLLFRFWLKKLPGLTLSSWQWYLFILSVTLLASCLILRLSKCRHCSWMKALY